MSNKGHRREVLKMLGAGTIVAAFPYVVRSAPAPVPGDYRDFFSPDLPDLRVLGTQPALSDEVTKAKEILDALRASSPFEIFNALASNKDTNKDGELYRGGWKERWNPLIVTMFKETTEKPSGDLTPWCAASLNWALAQSKLQGTRSASSGSFRDFPKGSATQSPQKGDIVVFRSADKNKASLGHGHVGLYVSQTATHVEVLGGNQINRQGHHEFSIKTLPKDGPVLVLHSFHPISAFSKV